MAGPAAHCQYIAGIKLAYPREIFRRGGNGRRLKIKRPFTDGTGRYKEKRISACGANPFFLLMVRLAGIEPTTPWFVAKYSIQLSYSRVSRNYNSAKTFWEVSS
jgi:hypothetical protein